MGEIYNRLTREIKRGSPAFQLRLSYILDEIKPKNIEEAIASINFIVEVVKPGIEERLICVNTPLNVRDFISNNIPGIFEAKEMLNIDPNHLDYSTNWKLVLTLLFYG